MSTRVTAASSRFDVTPTQSAPRVTPPTGAPFQEIVARGSGAIVRGAEAAVMTIPGAPIVAAAVRPGASSSAGGAAVRAAPTSTGSSAESPVAQGTGASGSVENALAQSQDQNLYYLQLQEQLAAENRAYTAMSNVLKARHETVKNAIGNIR